MEYSKFKPLSLAVIINTNVYETIALAKLSLKINNVEDAKIYINRSQTIIDILENLEK